VPALDQRGRFGPASLTGVDKTAPRTEGPDPGHKSRREASALIRRVRTGEFGPRQQRQP